MQKFTIFAYQTHWLLLKIVCNISQQFFSQIFINLSTLSLPWFYWKHQMFDIINTAEFTWIFIYKLFAIISSKWGFHCILTHLSNIYNTPPQLLSKPTSLSHGFCKIITHDVVYFQSVALWKSIVPLLSQRRTHTSVLYNFYARSTFLRIIFSSILRIYQRFCFYAHITTIYTRVVGINKWLFINIESFIFYRNSFYSVILKCQNKVW